MTDNLPERAPLTVFTTSWCGPCTQLKQRLTDKGISFVEVDVETDEDAALVLASINDGNMTVPTVQFVDGSSLTNPSIERVAERLVTVAAAGAPPTT